jgi:hypothetical protein
MWLPTARNTLYLLCAEMALPRLLKKTARKVQRATCRQRRVHRTDQQSSLLTLKLTSYNLPSQPLFLLQQLQYALLVGIGLGQNSRRSLLHDLCTRQLCRS